MSSSKLGSYHSTTDALWVTPLVQLLNNVRFWHVSDGLLKERYSTQSGQLQQPFEPDLPRSAACIGGQATEPKEQ